MTTDTCKGCRFYTVKNAGSSPCSYFHYCNRDPLPVLRKEQRPIDCRDYQRLAAPGACAFKDVGGERDE